MTLRSKFAETLKSVKRDGVPVSIFFGEPGSESFEVGFVEHVGEQTVRLLCLSPRGEPDGSISLELGELTGVEWGDTYTRKIHFLYQHRGTVFSGEGDAFQGYADELDEVLLRSMASGKIVSLYDGAGNCFCGWVREVAEDFVDLELVDSAGSPDGRAVVFRNAIRRIDVGRREEQARAFLFRIDRELKSLFER